MTHIPNRLPQTLPTKTMSQAVEEAKSEIDIERSGQITGLYCRWRKMNRFMMKYWRFATVTTIVGASGSGKSAILNMLEDDFTNPELNQYFHYKINGGKFVKNEDKYILEPKIIVVAFKYEMTAADEILRNLSGKVKKSYANLLSSEVIIEDSKKSEVDIYNRVNDQEFEKYIIELDKLKSRSIVFIESAGNLEQLYNTCKLVSEQNPGKKLIVTVDHSLLSQKLSEKDDLELSSATAHMAIKLKKTLKAMVIFLMQLNGKIEEVARRDNPTLQFPTKADIHCGNQVYWACDNVLIYHRPELLGITKYGNNPFPLETKNLIHCAGIKSRKNKPISLFYENKFSEGNMIETTTDIMKWKSKNDFFKI